MSETRLPKVLFLGNSNSSRSLMAEAFVRHYAADRFEPYSAGLAPSGVNPFTQAVMAERGISLEGEASTSVIDYLGNTHFGYLITVCDYAESHCPRALVGISMRYYWNIEDPGKFDGDEGATLAKYRAVRDELDNRVQAWLSNPKAGAKWQ